LSNLSLRYVPRELRKLKDLEELSSNSQLV
jgi:hypothetical protein